MAEKKNPQSNDPAEVGAEGSTAGTGSTAEPPNQAESQPDQNQDPGQTVGEPMPMHQGSVHSQDAIEQDQPADEKDKA